MPGLKALFMLSAASWPQPRRRPKPPAGWWRSIRRMARAWQLTMGWRSFTACWATPCATAFPAGGWVAVNPAYGERMEADDELAQLYRVLGDTLRNSFPGGRAIVLNGAGCRIGLRPERSWQMLNGPIECRLELFQLDSSS